MGSIHLVDCTPSHVVTGTYQNSHEICTGANSDLDFYSIATLIRMRTILMTSCPSCKHWDKIKCRINPVQKFSLSDRMFDIWQWNQDNTVQFPIKLTIQSLFCELLSPSCKRLPHLVLVVTFWNHYLRGTIKHNRGRLNLSSFYHLKLINTTLNAPNFQHFHLALLDTAPSSLSHLEIRFHIGHLYEVQSKFNLAKDMYETILSTENVPTKVRIWIF